MWAIRRFAAASVLCLAGAGCGGATENTSSCEGYEAPFRESLDGCDAPSLSDPTVLASCQRGSGAVGTWKVDQDGLPAYDLQVEQRCDLAGQHGSVLGQDPVHVVGNGRGVIGIAHASGAVEFYSERRGHKFINHVDTWDDPENPEYGKQLGGGYSYLVIDGEVHSTRWNDLSIGRAPAIQPQRRFGVGYFETSTEIDGIVVTRRVFAPEEDSEVLVAAVTLTNLSSSKRELDLVEFWDININQLTDELGDGVTSPDNVAGIQRRRRALMAEYSQEVGYNAETRLLRVGTTVKQLPPEVAEPDDPSSVDYFIAPIFLSVIDQGTAPTGVWLTEDELWPDDAERKPPASLKEKEANAESREITVDGAGQPIALAVRVPVVLPGAASVTRRFAFGVSADGVDPTSIAADLRQRSAQLRPASIERWKQSLVYATFPGFQAAGEIQREAAWASYYLAANAAFDDDFLTRVVSSAGAYRYFYGMEGPVGEMGLIAEALLFVDSALARDTLRYAMSTQHGTQSETAFRFPYASSGIDEFVDARGASQRSDAYFTIPAAAAQYIGATRDVNFLQFEVFFWPRVIKELERTSAHLGRIFDYMSSVLGIGARGMVAMGTGDLTDGILDAAGGAATPSGASSTVNAAIAARRFGLVADIVESTDPGLAAGYRATASEQRTALIDESWSGSYFYRGFADGGAPLADNFFFAAPQATAILAGIGDAQQATAALNMVESELGTAFGVRASTSKGGTVPADSPFVVDAVRPDVGTLVTQAWATVDPERAWQSLVQNSLLSHAIAHPSRWYGIWTGSAEYVGQGEGVGDATNSLLSAFGEYPALNLNAHAALLRSLQALVGVQATATGLRIETRVPGESFHVVWPELTLFGTPTLLSASMEWSGTELMTITVVLPTGLREAAVTVSVNGAGKQFFQDGDEVTFTLPPSPGFRVSWEVKSATAGQ